MECVNCEREIADEARFCQYCGARQPTVQEEFTRAGHEVAEATVAVVQRIVESAKPVARNVA